VADDAAGPASQTAHELAACSFPPAPGERLVDGGHLPPCAGESPVVAEPGIAGGGGGGADEGAVVVGLGGT